MEYWEPKADGDLILFSGPCHPDKIRSRSAKPGNPLLRRRLNLTAADGFIDLPFAREENKLHSLLSVIPFL
jgi:hypothetical protein